MISLEKLRRLLYVMMTTDEPCTGAFLANAAGISLKSLQNAISDFNGLLKGKHVQIIPNKGKGYVLQIGDRKEYELLKRSIVDNYLVTRFYMNDRQYRISDFVRNLLTHDNGLFLANYASRTFYSESTISKDLKLVRDLLNDFGLHLIHKKKSGFMIRGDEFNRRYCLAAQMRIYQNNSVLIEQDKSFKDLFEFKKSFYQKIDAVIREETMKDECYIPYTQMNYLTWWTVLGKSRMEFTGNIRFSASQKKELQSSPSYALSDRIYKQIAKISGLFFDKRNVLGLCVLLNAFREDWSEEGQKLDQSELMAYMDRYYPQYYRYDPDNFDQKVFLDGIQKKLNRVLYARRYHVLSNRDAVMQIQMNSIGTMEHAILLSRFLRNCYGIALTQDEIAEFYFIFSSYVMKQIPSQKLDMNVILINGRGQDEAECLLTPIQRNHYINFNINTCLYKDIQTVDFSKYSYAIRNEKFNLKACGIPVLDIHYQGFFLYPQLRINDEPFGRHLMQQLFRPEFFFREKLTSRKQALTAVRKIAENQLNMPPQFMDEVHERDGLLSSERNNQIVFLKSFQSFDAPDFISVIVSEKPFVWKSSDCRIIIIDHTSKDKKWAGFKNMIYHRIIRNYKDFAVNSSDITYDSLVDMFCSGMDSIL